MNPQHSMYRVSSIFLFLKKIQSSLLTLFQSLKHAFMHSHSKPSLGINRSNPQSSFNYLMCNYCYRAADF